MTDYNPEIIRTGNGNDFANTSAQILWESFESAKSPLIALPTGNTPLDVYKALIEQYRDRQDIWQNFRYVSLDEYIGLAPDDERLFANWLGRELLDQVGITKEHRKIFDSLADNPQQEAANMEQWIFENPIDIAVLGLGTNGHVAFNEPGSSFESITRIVSLSPETKETNAQYWGGIDKVPEKAYTLGLKTLSSATQVFLLVSGAHKAGILDKVLNGPITEDIPASILRTRPNVTVIADRAALKS